MHYSQEMETGSMKILGVDPGNVRIGIAIGDEETRLAHGLGIVTHVSREKDAQKIAQLAIEQGCGKILVGLPLDSEGQVGPRARSVLRLVEAIQDQFGNFRVLTWDESHTSNDMDDIMLGGQFRKSDRQKDKDDKVAALLLLDYLNRENGEED